MVVKAEVGLGEGVVWCGVGRVGGLVRLVGLQRARILAAMVEACVECGVGNVTVADVVERAGVSRRTFYEVFADCEDCFVAAFEDGVARARRVVLAGYDPEARWSERVRVALMALLEFFDGERGTGWLLIVGSLGGGAGVLERRRRVLAQIVAMVDEGREQAKNGDGLPPLTAEGIVGGVISVLHSRLLDTPPSTTVRDPSIGSPVVPEDGSLVGLTGPLMGMIVLPYLGVAAARRELARSAPKRAQRANTTPSNPLMRLEMRLTYRTVRVLMAIAANPGSSNRIIAEAAGVTDQGQMSKLLTRLAQLELIANTGAGPTRGEPNAWTLTDKGWHVQNAIAEQTTS
jgi:AcrR family transcriptional regulator/DNA-binding MarR family transcriptional regulator